ncbi:hypothetical protein EYV94_15945 [Puteibacter caeruleilacunae]|nr:hypothetical protein EYV94_15945 [Puteibacter caeruleilacunae]
MDTLAWETPGTFYHTWGYKSWVKGDPLDIQIVNQIKKLSQIAARGGNFLLNIGPKSDGTVLPYEVDVLKGIGAWMKQNGEAIYGTGTTPFRKLPWGECTTKPGKLYLHVFDWPKDGKLQIPGLKNKITKAVLLTDKSVDVEVLVDGNEPALNVSHITPSKSVTVLEVAYEGKLKIQHGAVTKKSGEYTLTDEFVINHGKYGRESYRSILKDYYRTWDVKVENPGTYEVSISYKMKYDQKDFVLECEKQEIPFTLNGAGVKKEKAEVIDGNENPHHKKNSTGGASKESYVIGKLHFDKKGVYTITLKQGQPFEFKTTMVDFKQQDHKYRSMNIDVDKIVLKSL